MATRASATAAEIFIDSQFMAAFAAQNSSGGGLFCLGPDLGWVAGECLMAADAGVVITTALVTNGDDVALGMPMGALR